MNKKELIKALEQIEDDEQIYILASQYGTHLRINKINIFEYENIDRKGIELITFVTTP